MKKIISVICIIALLSGITVAANGCIFSNGSLDEVKGIYGVEEYWYSDINKVTHSFGETYDYYIVVLYDTAAEGDNTYNGKVYCKPTDGEEDAYDVTYTVVYDTEKTSTVSTIKIHNFKWNNYSLDANGNAVASTAPDGENVDFGFRPKREDIVCNQSTLKKDANGSIVNVKTRLQFEKIYGTTTDNRIEKAKTKQTDSRTDRTSSPND